MTKYKSRDDPEKPVMSSCIARTTFFPAKSYSRAMAREPRKPTSSAGAHPLQPFDCVDDSSGIDQREGGGNVGLLVNRSRRHPGAIQVRVRIEGVARLDQGGGQRPMKRIAPTPSLVVKHSVQWLLELGKVPPDGSVVNRAKQTEVANLIPRQRCRVGEGRCDLRRRIMAKDDPLLLVLTRRHASYAEQHDRGCKDGIY